MSYTSAPWTVVHELRDADEAVCDLVNKTWVIKSRDVALGECDDDARLISAAPDLLGLLLSCRTQLPLAAATWNEDEDEVVAKFHTNYVMELIEKVDAAIAKATGATS